MKVFNRIPLPDRVPGHREPAAARAVGRTFEARTQGDVAEIDLYDEIGFFGITAEEFRRTLRSITAPKIRLSVNSPGGDVFDGIAMYNDLLDHPAEIEVRVTGLAASAASLISMAGDRIEMAQNAFMMIHNAWGIARGEKAVLRELADLLDKIDGALANTYVVRTGLERSTVVGMLDAETWMTAAEAVDKGFADATAGSDEPKARFDLSGFRNAPRSAPGLSQSARPVPQTKRDLERLLTHDAGLSRSEARAALGAVSPDATQDAGAALPDDVMQDADGAFIAALTRLRDSLQT